MILKCICCCSAIEIEKYDEELGHYCVSLWKRHLDISLSLKDRLRWCWNILTTGDPWSDHVILTKEDFEKLRNYDEKN